MKYIFSEDTIDGISKACSGNRRVDVESVLNEALSLWSKKAEQKGLYRIEDLKITMEEFTSDSMKLEVLKTYESCIITLVSQHLSSNRRPNTFYVDVDARLIGILLIGLFFFFIEGAGVFMVLYVYMLKNELEERIRRMPYRVFIPLFFGIAWTFVFICIRLCYSDRCDAIGDIEKVSSNIIPSFALATVFCFAIIVASALICRLRS